MIHAQSPREGWIRANADTSIYVGPLPIFESKEVASVYRSNGSFSFNYYITDNKEPSTMNGVFGMLAEYAAQNQAWRVHLSQKKYYEKLILSDKTSEREKISFVMDSPRKSVYEARIYLLLALKYAKEKRPVYYAEYVTNSAFRLAYSLAEAETNRLAIQCEQLEKELFGLLADKGYKVMTGKYVFIGKKGYGTFKGEIDSIMAVYQNNYHQIFSALRVNIDQLQKVGKIHDVIIQPLRAIRFGTDESKRDFFLAITKIVDADAHTILCQNHNYADYTKYAGDTSFSEVLGSINTVIHEECHYQSAQIGGYFVTKNIQIPVVVSAVYNSREFDVMVPNEYRKKIFRYTYINEGANKSSQTYGIYGLLDEFAAYYHGDKIDYEVSYNINILKNQLPDYRRDLKQRPPNSTASFYEFMIFMAWYLDFAKNNYVQQYQEICSNTNFKVCFTLLEKLYQVLVQKIQISYDVKTNPLLLKLYNETNTSLQVLRIPDCGLDNYLEFISKINVLE